MRVLDTFVEVFLLAVLEVQPKDHRLRNHRDNIFENNELCCSDRHNQQAKIGKSILIKVLANINNFYTTKINGV